MLADRFIDLGLIEKKKGRTKVHRPHAEISVPELERVSLMRSATLMLRVNGVKKRRHW